jgi:hypothetical protein
MGDVDFPLKLTVACHTYTLMSRGFWNGTHYWCKVHKKANGLQGIWLHNNQEN